MKKETPKITIVFPSFARVPWGGAKIAFLHANLLCEAGAEVTICFDCSGSLQKYGLPDIVRRAICTACVFYYPRWFPLDRKIKKKCIFKISDDQVPDADHVVATAVETAEQVHWLSKKKGKKHYLIQGFENWKMGSEDVRRTYRFGMSNIVVSKWLEEIVGKEAGEPPVLISNPIDEGVFYPIEGIRRSDTIAVLYHEAKHKGFDVLYSAINLVKDEYPSLRVLAFGSPDRPDYFPEWIEYKQNATQEDLRQIYSASQIYACATRNEGFGLTLAESMYCGCALVSTSFPGVYEYADSSCAVLLDEGGPGALARAIVGLLENPERAREIARKGREYALSKCSMAKVKQLLIDEFELG